LISSNANREDPECALNNGFEAKKQLIQGISLQKESETQENSAASPKSLNQHHKSRLFAKAAITPSDPRFRRRNGEDCPVMIHNRSFGDRLESAMKKAEKKDDADANSKRSLKDREVCLDGEPGKNVQLKLDFS